MRPRSEFEWLWVERPELRIVSDELCVQAQARRAERRFSLTDRTQGVRPKYLLTGLCVCGECGGRYIVQYHRHGVRHFGCAVHYDRGATVCRSDKLVRRDVLESKVLEHVFGDLFAPERLDCLEAAVGAALRSADGQALSMLRSVRRRFRISGASVTTS